MKDFKISIIIPVYKVELYIKDCLRSVIMQEDAGPLECIIVNDCTPDRSMKIATEIINKYTGSITFRIIHHEQNQGLSAARNSGVKVATGNYLYFLDSDDELLPNTMKALLHATLKYPSTNFVIGDIQVENSTIKYPLDIPDFVRGDQILTDYIMKKWYVMAWNKLINKEFFLKNNLWFIDGIVHEDVVFSFHLALRAKEMACCKDATYIYKIRTNGSIMSQISIKKYLDYLQGIEYNFRMIQQELPPNTNIPIYRYIINSIYGFILSANDSVIIDDNLKKKSIQKAITLLQSLRKYKQYVGIDIFIKELFIHLPFTIQKKCFSLHSIIKKASLIINKS